MSGVKRPMSVTILAWNIIILSGISLILDVILLADSFVSGQYLIRRLFITVLVGLNFFAGIDMLRGRRWVLLFYPVMILISMIFSTYYLITQGYESPTHHYTITSLFFYALIYYTLTRPKAKRFFES